MSVFLNADMGESFGILSFGQDETLIEYVDRVNVAAGFHAGDPDTINETVELARHHGVQVGAHPGYPDLVGFGRRPMQIPTDSLRNLMLYQVCAIRGFLEFHGMRLSHIKPHGALFGFLSQDEDGMHALCDIAEEFDVPVFGLPGTAHETVTQSRGVQFYRELYLDLDYQPDYTVKVKPKAEELDIPVALERLQTALESRQVKATDGTVLDIAFDTVCIHSDLPNVIAAAKAIRSSLIRDV